MAGHTVCQKNLEVWDQSFLLTTIPLRESEIQQAWSLFLNDGFVYSLIVIYFFLLY